MSTKKKNFYEEKHKKKTLLGLTSALSNKKVSPYKLSHLILGGLGGGLTGIVTGRASLLIGLAVTGAGTYLKSPTAAMFGVGLMASGGYQTISGMNGLEKAGMEGIKERFGNFTAGIKHQLFLDKLLGKKKKMLPNDDGTNGVGQVQYIRHPGEEDLSSGLDFTEANRIERQINESAKRFEARHRMDGTDGVDGIEDRLF
jgi:hypothetical protein